MNISQARERPLTCRCTHTGHGLSAARLGQLREIPYGEIRSYGEPRRRGHEPKAVRAVGTANSMNRIAIMIPCHQVIGADGALTGYGGLWRKTGCSNTSKSTSNNKKTKPRALFFCRQC
ncbi:MAG: methylated-DNA--[protein]-cysteine S-methyltransferase [Eubacteriales bacterium]